MEVLSDSHRKVFANFVIFAVHKQWASCWSRTQFVAGSKCAALRCRMYRVISDRCQGQAVPDTKAETMAFIKVALDALIDGKHHSAI